MLPPRLDVGGLIGDQRRQFLEGFGGRLGAVGQGQIPAVVIPGLPVLFLLLRADVRP